MVTIAIAIYVIAGQKPPVATGEIVEVWAHPMHAVTPAFDANGAAMPQRAFDQVLVFTHVQLHNQSKEPLFLHQIMTNATLADGSPLQLRRHSRRNTIASSWPIPTLAPWHSTPLSPETTIEAGQTVEGTFVSAFRMTKQQWDARKDLDFTFGFRYQPNVKLDATGRGY